MLPGHGVLPALPEPDRRLRRVQLPESDLAARYTAYRTGILTGFLKVNEVRIAEGLEPVPGGDVLMQPLNMGPVGGDGLGSDMNGVAPDGVPETLSGRERRP